MNPELKMGEKKKMRKKRLTYLQTRKVSIQRTELNQKKKHTTKQNRIKNKKKTNKTIKYWTIPTGTLSGVIRKTVPKGSYIIL